MKRFFLILIVIAIIFSMNVYAEQEVVTFNNYEIHNIDDSICVSVTEPVDYVELFIDDVLIETDSEAPYEFDVTNMTLGTKKLVAKAYKNELLIGSKEFYVKFIKPYHEVYVDTDFESTLPSMFSGVSTKNISRGKTTIDGNTVYKIGNAAEGASAGYLQYGDLNVSTGKIHFETKILFSTTDLNKVIPSALYYNQTGARASINDVVFTNGNVQVYENGELTNKCSFQADTWYSIKYSVDIEEGTYSVKLSGNNTGFEVSDLSIGLSDTAQFASFSSIRLKFDATATQNGYIIVDDSSLTRENGDIAPYIMQVGNEENIIEHDASEINVVTNGLFSNISKDNVTVKSNDGSVSVNDVDINENNIKIFLGDSLEAGTKYTLIFDEDCKISEYAKIGRATIEYFTTTPQSEDDDDDDNGDDSGDDNGDEEDEITIALNTGETHDVANNISVSVTNTVDYVELFIDEALIGTDNEAPYEFDVANMTLGTKKLVANAYKDSLLVDSNETYVKFTKLYNEMYIDVDYESTLTKQISVVNSNNIESGKVTLDGNAAYKLGNSAPGTSSGYMQFEDMNIASGKIHFETEILFSTTDLNKVIPSFVYYNQTGARASINDLVFTNGDVQVYEDGILKTKCNFVAEEWYSIKYSVDINNATYSVKFNGGNTGFEISDLPIGLSDTAQFVSFASVRLKYETTDSQNGYVVVDDSSLRREDVAPYVKYIGNNQNSIEFDSSELNIAINGSFSNITRENVSITSRFGSVLVENVEIGESNVKILLGEKFDSATEYILTFDENCQISDYAKLGQTTIESFTTTPQSEDVVSFISSDSSNIGFTAKLCSQSNEQLMGLVIIYDHAGRIVQIIPDAIEFENNTATWSKTTNYPQSSYKIKCFIIKDYETGIIIGDKILD